MLCPTCRIELRMMDRQGIEVDYCPGCRGVWLDRGELDKLIERSLAWPAPAGPEPALPPQPSRRPEYDGHDDRWRDFPGAGRARKPKRESFLSELFDWG